MTANGSPGTATSPIRASPLNPDPGPIYYHVKPRVFQGEPFNGEPDRLSSFFRHLERDFLLYGSNFPSDSHRVAYALSGLTNRADVWASQYHYRDQTGILGNWTRFKAALQEHFQDPDLIAHKEYELLSLRHTGDLMDFVLQFEALAAQVQWPKTSWASIFLKGLRPAVAHQVRVSEVEMRDYNQVKAKALRIERQNALMLRERQNRHFGVQRTRPIMGTRQKSNSPRKDRGQDQPSEKSLSISRKDYVPEQHMSFGQVSTQGDLTEEGRIMKQLFGGRSFSVSGVVTSNKSSFPVKGLLDSGAGGWIFINADLAIRIANETGVKLKRLPRDVRPEGFDGTVAPAMRHILHATIQVEGEKFEDTPMVLTKLGRYDLILGRNWMAAQKIHLDMKNSKIIWPAKSSLSKQGVKEPQQDLASTKESSAIDVAQISALSFLKLARNSENECFMTSLNEIASVITSKASENPKQATLTPGLPQKYRAYADVFSETESNTLPPHRQNVDMKIQLEGDVEKSVGHSPLYKMSTEELEAARTYIIENLDKGFITPSTAPFASPVIMAKKPGGGLRLCVDYRKLNALTTKDRYPLPLIDESLERLGRAKLFTKLDIRQGFHRIRMAPDCEDLTTFRTRYGSFKYKVMPFGLSNGPAYFQRFINSIFADCLDKFIIAFIDDILIYSENEEDHEEHVRIVLDRLRKNGLQAALHKCEFHVSQTKYLGFVISKEGVSVDPSKVAAIKDWAKPTTVRGVQSFLGFCNFYRRFIRDYARIASPLTNLTKKGAPFVWDSSCNSAFEELKKKLTSAPTLIHYRPNAKTRLETDASDETIAGVLSQEGVNGVWHPVSFYSHKMKGPELNYDIHDKELLAIVRALEEWRAELEGLQHTDAFEIYTDHRSLQYFMTKRTLSARQARWAEFLSRFRFIITYRSGKQNVLADALTRFDIPGSNEHKMQLMLPSDVLDDKVKSDLELAPIDTEISVMDDIIQANRLHKSLEDKRQRAANGDSNWQLIDGLLTFKSRLEVPKENESLITKLLTEIHSQKSTAHPGRNKTVRLVSSRYHWPGWKADVDRFVRNCQACQRYKNPRDKIPGLLQSLPIADRPWQHLSMDFISLPKDKHNFDSALVVVDRFSKCPISIPCHKTDGAPELAHMFLTHVYRHHGVPDSIVSDRGGQFVAEFWSEMCKILGIKQKLSSAHHPQTDGQTEITNQHIESRLRPYVSHFQDNWSELLPIIDHAAGFLHQETIGMSPFMASCGYEPRVSFDWSPAAPAPQNTNRKLADAARARVAVLEKIWKLVHGNIRGAQEQQQQQANRHRREVDWKVGDHVWLLLKDYDIDRPSRKLAEQRSGPFRVLEQVGNAWKLDLPGSMNVHPIFSPDKLRKAAQDPLDGQKSEQPPPITVNDTPRYVIEAIVDSRIRWKKLFYRVKWLGEEGTDTAWQPARNFRSAWVRVKEFHDAHPDKPGPPKRLQNWIDEWQPGQEAKLHRDDDYPV